MYCLYVDYIQTQKHSKRGHVVFSFWTQSLKSLTWEKLGGSDNNGSVPDVSGRKVAAGLGNCLSSQARYHCNDKTWPNVNLPLCAMHLIHNHLPKSKAHLKSRFVRSGHLFTIALTSETQQCINYLWKKFTKPNSMLSSPSMMRFCL